MMVYWIWLTQIKGIGPVLQKRLLSHFKDVELIYNSDEEDLLLVEGIGSSLAKNIKNSKCLEKSNLILKEVHKNYIKMLTFDDLLYPSFAKKPHDSPILLYYKGTIRKSLKGVAIVGSRRCSEYGKQVTVEAARYLAQNDVPVISGMAKGIDSYAHTACIKEGGYTIAFLGNGLDICYPIEHIKLMEAIIENGSVISQFPPGTRPRREYFPKRNALISGWSEKILVAEAAEKSGALITAEIAKKQGKEIFVVPHEIYSSTGTGTNKLLSQGANVYLNPYQLLLDGSKLLYKDKFLDLSVSDLKDTKIIKRKKTEDNNLIGIEKEIVNSINDGIKTIEDIGKDIEMDEVELLTYLSIMEITGVIESLPGGRFKYIL